MRLSPGAISCSCFILCWVHKCTFLFSSLQVQHLTSVGVGSERVTSASRAQIHSSEASSFSCNWPRQAASFKVDCVLTCSMVRNSQPAWWLPPVGSTYSGQALGPVLQPPALQESCLPVPTPVGAPMPLTKQPLGTTCHPGVSPLCAPPKEHWVHTGLKQILPAMPAEMQVIHTWRVKLQFGKAKE